MMELTFELKMRYEKQFAFYKLPKKLTFCFILFYAISYQVLGLHDIEGKCDSTLNNVIFDTIFF